MEKQMHGFRAWLDYILKHNYWIYRFFSFSTSALLRFWGLFISQDSKLILFSAHSRKYNDSPRKIYETMINQPRFSDFKFIWALEDPDNAVIPGRALKIKSDTVKYFYFALKAKYWISCVNIERGLHFKKKGCKYLNTWHGTPFKYIGNDIGSRNDYDFSHIDYVCYASEYEKDIFLRAFKTNKNAMIPCGLPRNDELYQVKSSDIQLIKNRLAIPSNKKVILYAPTWRDSKDGGVTYTIKPPIDTNYWEKELGSEYVVLFRTHGYTNKLLGIEFNDVIRDFSAYPSINDLLIISDILISDYSATMADFSILERPVICFVYDYDEYKAERGLYLDFDKDMPSGVLKTQEAVLNHIRTMDYNKECEKTKNMIKNRIIKYGGQATNICIESMFGAE